MGVRLLRLCFIFHALKSAAADALKIKLDKEYNFFSKPCLKTVMKRKWNGAALTDRVPP